MELKHRIDKRIQQVDRVAVQYHFTYHFPRYHDQPFKADCNVCNEQFRSDCLDMAEVVRFLTWLNEHSTSCDLRGME